MNRTKTMILLFGLMMGAELAQAQSYVTIIYDSKHLAIVGQNAAARSAAEIMHNSYLSTIKDRLNDIRSEEHTSELQSLMSISYAVFCLKKKKIKNLHEITSNKINTTQQVHKKPQNRK